MFENMYTPYAHERHAFGENWTGPPTYRYGEDDGCALYTKRSGSAGQSVEVYCCAMPARFYTMKVLPGENSVGQPQAGYTIKTGSGQAELVAKLAEAIRDGMIDFEP